MLNSNIFKIRSFVYPTKREGFLKLRDSFTQQRGRVAAGRASGIKIH